MYSSSTSKKQKPTTSYLVRPRLGPGRSIFSSKPIMSSFGQDKRKKSKKYSGGKMEYRRRPDYADTAYREAVGRLRILLAESYTPIKRPLRELDSAGEDTDNQSLISATSRTSKVATRPYYHYLSMVPKRYYYPSIRPTSAITTDTEKNLQNTSKYETNSAPPELMSFIEKQEEYIEQLEKESRFCRDELSALLSKVKDVISENENLHEKQKSNVMKSVFNHLETETETETDIDLAQKISLSPKKSKKHKILEGPAIVFESRISELEAQLTQAKIDLKKALDDNDNYKKKMSDGTSLDGLGLEHNKKQIDSLLREKDLLQETVTKLQSALSKIRDKEHDTCDQVKRSLDAAEQAHYEKSAADIEIRRLKDELDRQHAKLRDAISDQSRRISDERSAVERRYTQQIEQLTTELGVQWETTNKLQLELDKQRRENSDLRRELAQKQALLDGMKKDMQNKIMSLQSDIGVNGAEKSALEQQIATFQMTNERNERQSKQEVTRLQAEIQSLRQRLDRADADLIHSRRENIRLNEQVASLEKEVKLNSAISEEKHKQSTNGEILALPPPKEQEKQLSSLIHDVESKHDEDYNSISNQRTLPSQDSTKKSESIESRNLSRTDSRSSVKQDTILPKKSSEETLPSSRYEPLKNDLQESQSNKNVTKPSSGYDAPQDYSPQQQSVTTTDENYDQNFITDDQNYIPQNEYIQNSANNDGPFYQGDLNAYPDESLHPYITDPNQHYTTDSNQEYAIDPNQQYPMDSDQQYAVDPTQQYSTDSNQGYEVDPTQQYPTDSNQGYEVDPIQQYSTGLNQGYEVDPNQQYAATTDQEYTMDPNQQQYMTDPNYTDPRQPYSSKSDQQYSVEPPAAEYSENSSKNQNSDRKISARK